MKKIVTCFTLALLLSASTIYGQRISKQGDLNKLKGIKDFNLEFNYDNMGVGKYDKEEDYLSEGVAKRNDSEEGKGDKWKAAWLSARTERYEPKFEELFGVYFEHGIASQNNEEAAVTIWVHTVHTEPGFNVGLVRKPASINFEVIFIDKNSGDELVTLTVLNVPGQGGMGFDFDAGFRLQESYAKLGKSLGKYLTRALK